MRSQYHKAEQRPSEVRNITEALKAKVDAFLSLSTSEQIKQLAAEGVPYRTIAKRTGTTVEHISNVLTANDRFQDDMETQNEIDDELEYQLREEHFDKIPDSFTHIGLGA